MEALRVRHARPDDAGPLAALHVDSWRAAYRGIFPDRILDDLSTDRFEASWRGHLGRPGRTNLVCELDGRIAGFAAFGSFRDGDADPERAVELYGLYVDPGHWGRKVGWALWRSVADLLTRQGFDEVVLHVLEANARARRFYERVGFVLDPGVVKRVERQGVTLPEVRYRRRLSARDADPGALDGPTAAPARPPSRRFPSGG